MYAIPSNFQRVLNKIIMYTSGWIAKNEILR